MGTVTSHSFPDFWLIRRSISKLHFAQRRCTHWYSSCQLTLWEKANMHILHNVELFLSHIGCAGHLWLNMNLDNVNVNNTYVAQSTVTVVIWLCLIRPSVRTVLACGESEWHFSASHTFSHLLADSSFSAMAGNSANLSSSTVVADLAGWPEGHWIY